MRTVLITGASGLLGRELVRQLCPSWRVICLGRNRPDFDLDFEFISADLGGGDLEAVLPARVDAVIHLAQSRHYNEFPNHDSEVFRVNLASAVTLLQWAYRAGATHFVHASTGGLYGLGPTPFTETDEVRISGRLAYYYSTKYAAEILASSYSNLLTVVALRYFFIYGPDQSSSMLMPRLVASVQAGKPITLVGGSGMKLNPIHVRDAAAATAAALSLKASGTINVAGPDVVTIRDLGETIGRQLGRTVSFSAGPGREGEHLIADISRMSENLGRPRIGVTDGICEMCKSALSEKVSQPR